MNNEQAAANELRQIIAAVRSGDFSIRITFASARACSAFCAALGDRVMRKAEIDPEFLAAVRRASESGATAGEHAGEVFFLNKGTELAHDPAQDCPACGGSGHKDDVTLTSEGDTPTAEEIEALADGNGGMLFEENFIDKLNKLAKNLRLARMLPQQPADCPACKEHDQLGCPTAQTGIYAQQPAKLPPEWEKHVSRMWQCVRKNDSDIPSDDLDLMRQILLTAVPTAPEGDNPMPPKPSEQPFVNWGGGECPVTGDIIVEYVLKGSPSTINKSAARMLDWSHEFSPMAAHIVKYRAIL